MLSWLPFEYKHNAIPEIDNKVEHNGKNITHHNYQRNNTSIWRLLHPQNKNGKHEANIADERHL
jgi:hypothetical protein